MYMILSTVNLYYLNHIKQKTPHTKESGTEEVLLYSSEPKLSVQPYPSNPITDLIYFLKVKAKRHLPI